MGRGSVLALPVILALLVEPSIRYTLKTYEPRKGGITRIGSIYSRPVLQYQEAREENREEGSNLLVQYRFRRGVVIDVVSCLFFGVGQSVASSAALQSESAGRRAKRPTLTYNDLAGKPEQSPLPFYEEIPFIKML
ncbi:unnamed protein product, partial [Porites evermanni]